MISFYLIVIILMIIISNCLYHSVLEAQNLNVNSPKIRACDNIDVKKELLLPPEISGDLYLFYVSITPF